MVCTPLQQIRNGQATVQQLTEVFTNYLTVTVDPGTLGFMYLTPQVRFEYFSSSFIFTINHFKNHALLRSYAKSSFGADTQVRNKLN